MLILNVLNYVVLLYVEVQVFSYPIERQAPVGRMNARSPVTISPESFSPKTSKPKSGGNVIGGVDIGGKRHVTGIYIK